jgi:hypothetical protein
MIDDTQFSTNAPKLVPYDTGKIKIGIRYEQPRFTPSDDERMIQGVLLPNDPPLRHNIWIEVLEWGIILSVIAVCVLYFVKD